MEYEGYLKTFEFKKLKDNIFSDYDFKKMIMKMFYV